MKPRRFLARPRGYGFALVYLLLAGCAITPPSNESCQSSTLSIDHAFEGGNFHRCDFLNDDEARILIRPEDPGRINPSPWYAFRIESGQPADISLVVDFAEHTARYWPKLSSDGQTWRRATGAEARMSETENAWLLDLRTSNGPLWVSAQELITVAYFDAWLAELAAHEELTVSELGQSVLGRPIRVAQTAPRREVIYLIGRQHPPEVSGTLSMRSFVSTVLGDTPLARRFRERYALVIFPLINPDGVARGHWRHNMNGVDLNRDWGPFTQPETRAAAQLVTSIEESALRPALMLDFHSTRDSLFYTQLPEESSWDIDFATEWFRRFRDRRPDFEFKHDARARSGQANTKNFFYDRYRIPAITYEIGDEEDRSAIADTTPVFAEEMMRLMLETPETAQVVNRERNLENDERPPPVPLP